MRNRQLIFRSLGFSGTVTARIVLAGVVNINAQLPASAQPDTAAVAGCAFLKQYCVRMVKILNRSPQSKIGSRHETQQMNCNRTLSGS